MLRKNDLIALPRSYRSARVDTTRRLLPTLAVLILVGVVLEAIPAKSETTALAQGNDVQSEIVGQLPAGHFLENIARAPDGSYWITDYVGRAIYRYTPDTGFRYHLELDVHQADIAFVADGTAFVTAQTESVLSSEYQPSNLILKITSDGTQEVLGGGGVFFNRIAAIGECRFIIADSGTDTLWTFDEQSEEISAWLSDPLLSKSDPQAFTPGANGVQVFQNDLYVSNSERAVLMRIGLPLVADSRLETVLSDTVIDDFAFMDDGALVATSHGDTVFTVDMETGAKSTIAGIEDGVGGSTSLVVTDRGQSILVVTDGGLFQGCALGTANLVRLRAD